MGLRVDHQTTLVVVPATTHGAHTSTHEHDDKAQCTVYGARMSTRQDSKRVADPRDTGAGVHDFKKDSHRERKRERERKSERKREREREREAPARLAERCPHTRHSRACWHEAHVLVHLGGAEPLLRARVHIERTALGDLQTTKR